MKFLFVGAQDTTGGTEAHFIELCLATRRAGHDVAAVVRDGGFIAHALKGAVPLIPARFDRSTDPAGARDLVAAARRLRPDWLVASFRREYYAATTAARAAGARVAVFKHNALASKRLTRWALPRLANVLFVPSTALKLSLIREGFPAAKLKTLYNPIDTLRFAPDDGLRAAMRSQLGYELDDVVIGFVGRIEPEKGTDVLALAADRAMATNPRIRMLWVGDGKWSGALARHIESSGRADRHTRVGWVDDARPFYAAMDALALPSTRAESFGRASAEAQACGVPVIGSDLDGIPETLNPGATGLLVAPGDVDAWCAAIRLMTDDAQRKSMAHAAPRFIAERFASDIIVAQFCQLLETIA